MTELREKLNNIVEDYNACKILAKSVGNPSVYEGTTATAEDIREGKTAYSNGELIEGILEANDYNAKMKTLMSYAGTSNGSTLYRIIKELPKDFRLGTNPPEYVFMNCSSLETVPELDLSNRSTSAKQMFSGCSSLKQIKLKNTSGVTNFYRFAQACTSLEDVEIDSMAGITGASNLSGMFSGCSSLTDETLNNIMLLCTTASCTSSLSYIGLSGTQISKCKKLSNYQAFIDAGWS